MEKVKVVEMGSEFTMDAMAVMERIGGYLSDIDLVKRTLEEISRTKDPLSELEERIENSEGTGKGDLRILYNEILRYRDLI